MTSTTDTAGHPDVTEISDLTEGLLAPSRAEDLRRHLGECASCAEVHASLEEIRSLLVTLPEPQGVPSDVADRIDAALAAEHSTDGYGGSAGDSTHVSRETTASDRPAGRARTSSTGPGRKAATRRGRRRITVLGTALTVAALGVVSVIVASVHDGKGSETTAHGRPSASADTFSEETLKTHVTGLLDKAQKTEGTSHAPHSLGVDTDRGTGKPNVLKSAPTVTVPSCVRQGINNAGTPLAAQEGTFEGKDAYLVVLPDASGTHTRVTAYIVDATCVQHPSAAATVLLQHSYARS